MEEVDKARENAKKVFPKRLYRAMKNSGKKRSEVEAEVGVAESTFTRYLQGATYPGFANIVGFAKCLGVSADWLLGLE